MRADMPAQRSVNETHGVPSSCDIVVVLLWSRMGTPRTAVLIYHGTEIKPIDPTSADRTEQLREWDLVQSFSAIRTRSSRRVYTRSGR